MKRKRICNNYMSVSPYVYACAHNGHRVHVLTIDGPANAVYDQDTCEWRSDAKIWHANEVLLVDKHRGAYPVFRIELMYRIVASSPRLESFTAQEISKARRRAVELWDKYDLKYCDILASYEYRNYSNHKKLCDGESMLCPAMNYRMRKKQLRALE